MIDFTNCAFLIPYKKSNNQDRENNLIEILKYLNVFLKTNVIVMQQENDNDHTLNLINLKNLFNLNIVHGTHETDIKCFHKTKLYNLGMIKVKTDIVIPYDVDVLFPIQQLIKSKELLMSGYDYSFPFNKNYIEISKKLPIERKKLLKDYDFDYYVDKITTYQNNSLIQKIEKNPPGVIRNCPPGGCIFIKKSVYIDMGLENENFCGYAPEDQERKSRLKKLNYKEGIVDGNLFHIEHDLEPQMKRISNNENKNIFNLLEKMNVDELKKYYEELNYKERYQIA
jgi:hypothetical protein